MEEGNPDNPQEAAPAAEEGNSSQPALDLSNRFRCKKCNDDEPLLVPLENDTSRGWRCTDCTNEPTGPMVAACLSCDAIACRSCIEEGNRFLRSADWANLCKRLATLPDARAAHMDECKKFFN